MQQRDQRRQRWAPPCRPVRTRPAASLGEGHSGELLLGASFHISCWHSSTIQPHIVVVVLVTVL